jgi:hypothetical protein
MVGDRSQGPSRHGPLLEVALAIFWGAWNASDINQPDECFGS